LKYPDYVIEKLEKEWLVLDKSFSRLWGLLSPTPERDEMLVNIMKAKINLNKLIREQREELK
jgi:hypothetical protein